MDTPLHMAAGAGELDALCMLLRRGVSLNKSNDVRACVRAGLHSRKMHGTDERLSRARAGGPHRATRRGGIWAH
jgi:ankyrin repeat protein